MDTRLLCPWDSPGKNTGVCCHALLHIHIHIHTHTHTQWNIVCLVTQSCSTVCSLMDCSPPGSSVHGDSPGKNTGVGCHAPIQGIFPTQGSNSDLHCRWILYHLSHQESPQWNMTHLLRKNEIMPYAVT